VAFIALATDQLWPFHCDIIIIFFFFFFLKGPTLLTLPEQIQVALDVAHGCYYLEQQHFIHRDIAARNCLVSSKGADRVVKIGGVCVCVCVQ